MLCTNSIIQYVTVIQVVTITVRSKMFNEAWNSRNALSWKFVTNRQIGSIIYSNSMILSIWIIFYDPSSKNINKLFKITKTNAMQCSGRCCLCCIIPTGITSRDWLEDIWQFKYEFIKFGSDAYLKVFLSNEVYIFRA